MVLEVLKNCTVDGNTVKLPAGQLERQVYLDTKAKLEGIGGKWKGGKTQGFVFDHSPVELLASIANGDEINLKQDYQFFATPKDLADLMVSKIPFYESGMRVLEPSAGDGALVKAFVRRFGPAMVKAIECYEIMEQNLTKLRDVQGAMIKGMDFLTAKIQEHEHYDIIIANPPFSRNQDIDHIRKMYDVCKPGGVIITIASLSWTFGSHKKHTEFSEWLQSVNAQQNEIPAGTFKSSGTGVGAMLIEITKPLVDLNWSYPPIPGVEKFVEHQAKLKPVRACRVCGCTESDCSQCIEKTGVPCHWVEKDLCSACAEMSPDQILKSILQSHKDAEVHLRELEFLLNSNLENMNFFKQLQQSVPGADITIRVKEKNGKYTVSILNNVGGQTNLQPLLVTGMPEELDEKFFDLIAPPVVETTDQLLNLEQFKASVTNEVKKATEPDNKKPATAKQEPKETKAVSKPVKPSKADNSIEEPDLFEDSEEEGEEEGEGEVISEGKPE